MSIQSAKGTYDVLPNDVYKWHYIEKIMKDLCQVYNYKEMRTPIFESTDLFIRGVGESSDIVSKEMYTFLDKGDRSITLRPEGTAPIVRSYVQNKLYADANQLTKIFYMGPMFRYERMQKGRYRQFNQFGVEALGGYDPSIDVEVIALSVNIIKKLGLKEVKVAINTLGDQDSRDRYREALLTHFKPHQEELCGDCRKRLEMNPLRVLDCKVDRNHSAMKTAPKMMDYLNDESRTFFETVLNQLNDLKIEYVLDDSLVRGLDYYNHTVFEIFSNVEGFGAQTALAAGGRYNGLVEEIGGPTTPGIGIAFGMERLILALEAENITIPDDDYLDVYIISMNEKTDRYAFILQEKLRKQGLKVDKDYFSRKVKAQFKQGDKLNAKYTIVVGEEEIESNQVILKNMKTQQQEEILIDQVVLAIKEQMEE